MKKNTVYRCSKCGYESVSWTGKCPSCQAWGSLKETTPAEEESPSGGRKKAASSRATPLKEVTVDLSKRIRTGISELNRVLGGGLVKDSCTILTARPGAGKSTLLLEIAGDLADRDIKILYISGEESESQIRSRANRILEKIPENIWILSTTSMDAALENIRSLDPDLIFLDSIQTMTLEEYNSRAGSPVQTVECTNRLIEACKGSRPRASIMVGHMTKADEMAGLRTLEHMVDTVLLLEGESDEPLRVLVSTKNRFGRTGEIGLFEMGEDGLKEITDSGDFFITKRKNDVPGAALSMIKEGSRLIVVEVEALVSKSFTPYPQRIGDSLRKDQLNTLISILEERGGMNLYDKNVILKTTGGIRVSEQSVNLAIIMAIVSSMKNRPIDDRTVFIAEVGLTGELKKVPRLADRIRELDRLGYERCFTYPFDEKIETDRLEIVQCDRLSDVIRKVF